MATLRKGIAVSPGVAVGTAYCVPEIYVGPEAQCVDQSEVLDELSRFEQATEKTAADLRALYQKVATQVGESEAAVFRAHEQILKDPVFSSKIKRSISTERMTAQASLKKLLEEYSQLFRRTQDEYLKERLADLRDVIVRLSGHLSPVLDDGPADMEGPLILIADEILPSQVVTLGTREVAGIVTQRGGRTSHAAILARSRGIPAVSGVAGILRQVHNGDKLVVDGREGHVLINPDVEATTAYRKLQREFVQLKDTLVANRDQPARTADGESIELLANINNVADAEAATAMGATGVGLFRTEYLFLTHPDVPDEEEQYQAYRRIIEASPGRTVTIRTLDLGGDKTIPYLGHDREANPFMGWRSIRLSFEHPDFFATQLRAVLRAARNPDGTTDRVRLMFPMITTLEEMRRVRGLVRRTYRQLEDANVPCAGLPIGLMLEVPAAAIVIGSLLEVVDFVSIGSNDLVQYLMAADRDNPKVSYLFQPLSPPVLRVLSDVIQASRRAEKPITLCGEMAGQPRAVAMLLGMGLRSFSMSPAFIPTIKELLNHISIPQAEEIYRQAMKLKTTGRVNRFLGEQIRVLAPDLELLDSS